MAVMSVYLSHRVKQLRGQGGARGDRRSKGMTSPKQNQSSRNSSGSSYINRGKVPPKLRRQKDDAGLSTPSRRVSTVSDIFCSTPKKSTGTLGENGRRREEEIGLEHITPIRGWVMLGCG